MSRITNIISNVRVDLGDSDIQRYSDAILIRYLNDAISDFVLATKCLKERLYVGLNYSTAIYDLRPYVLEFIRTEYNGKTIEAKSFDELDKISSTWQVDTGDEVKYITFEHMSKGMFRIYPRVSGAIGIVTQNSLYGGIIDITISDDDYQIPSLKDIEEDISKYIVMYIVKKPSIVTIDTEDLEINSEYDKALEKYIKAMCLQSDTDSINRQYGAELLQMYSAYVESTTRSEVVSNNRIDDRIVQYRGGFQ